MKRTLGLGVLVVVVGVLAAVSSGGVLAATYDISFVDGLETPTETVEDGGNEYEIDEIGVIEPGETLEVGVTSPEDGDLLLYTADRQLETSASTDDGTVTVGPGADIDTSGLGPGSYMLSLEPDGEGRQAVAPVVIQGYDVSITHPSTAETDDEVTFEATVEPYDGQDQPDEVDLAIWNDDERTEVALEQTSGTNYENTTSLDLGPGTYEVYGAVPGDERVEGYSTVLAVGDGDTLTVTESEDAEDGTGGLPGGSDGESRDDNESVDDGGAIDGNESADNSTEPVDPDGTTEDAETESNDTESTTDGDGSDDENDSETNVIEPNEIEPNETNGTTAAETDDAASDDGLGTPAAISSVIALACFLTLAVRISR